ncbi:unnamed protein product [Calicophoron daubneyi]|uniref:DUF4773 domain-containing protein n=1 Tax=Calicophoron daubneyi TaxID=300641 RepID=A0AAV2TZB2_CALDB
MRGLLNARKKTLLIVIGCVLIFYFGISNLSNPLPISDLHRPPYALNSFSESEENTQINAKASIYPLAANYIPGFFATSSVVDSLLRHNAYYAEQLMVSIEKYTESPSNRSVTDSFACRCGRVSDACVCCGSLKFDYEPGREEVIPRNLYAPIITFKPGDSYPATLCINLTYIPRKQMVRTVGYLLPSHPLPSADGVQSRLVDFTLLVHPDTTLVLFDDQFLPTPAPPAICVENSRTEPVVGLCTLLSSLRYIYDSSSEHKTAFVGCGEVFLILKKRYIIKRYAPFCFRAHRGAIDDADQADDAELLEDSNSVQVPELDRESVHEIPKKNATSSQGSSAVEKTQLATTLEALGKPSSLLNGHQEPRKLHIPGPMDTHDAIQGGP